MYKSLIFIVLLFFSLSIQAQTDSTAILIGEVSVISRIEKLSSDNNIQEINPQILQNYGSENLAVLLSQNTGISIKQYGISGISTLSVRGGSSYHTAVIWNGFNIQDVLNGGFNFALAPSIIADNIKIKYGGSSAIYGSGAMGGSIHLSNKTVFNKGFKSESNFTNGSFGKLNIMQSIQYSNQKLFVAAKGFFGKTNNNFPFKNRGKAGFPTETLQNAAMEQFSIIFESSLKLKNHQLLNTHFWAQNNYSQLPPNMIAVGNEYAEQFDKRYRWAIEWKYRGKNLKLEARNGTFYSYINYINKAINLNAVHSSINNISELIADWRIFKKTAFETAINNNYINAQSDNFNGIKHQNRLSFFTSLKTKYFKKLILNANSRIEIIDQSLQPVTFGLYAEYNFIKNYFLNFNLSKNHRSPTLNDLYWGGAFAKGNPELKDESGYTADIGLIKKYEKEKIKFQSKMTTYYSIAADMIQWAPIEGIWTPQNQKKVQTYGLEFSANTQIRVKDKSKINIDANYTYTRAEIIEKSLIESNDVLNKQLIYTPYNQANIFISYLYKKIFLSVNNSYTGKQYTRSDNLDSLPPYFVTNLLLSYQFEIKKSNCKLYGKINNLLNTDYMQMQWYPMPPINYELGIKIIINSKNVKL